MKKAQEIIIVVNAIAINHEGKFLLTKRRSQNLTWEGKWQFAGGTMEFGESPEQTLAREIQEELGMSVEIISPYPIAKTYVWSDLTAGGQGDPEHVSGRHVLLLDYLVSIGDQQPQPENREIQDWGWYSLEELVDMDTLPLVQEFALEAQKIVEREQLV